MTTEKQIVTYFHCRKCLVEMPAGTSPSEWARLEMGLTETGLQVWCVRHDINVALLEDTPVVLVADGEGGDDGSETRKGE
jgi:hypothetical protein